MEGENTLPKNFEQQSKRLELSLLTRTGEVLVCVCASAQNRNRESECARKNHQEINIDDAVITEFKREAARSGAERGVHSAGRRAINGSRTKAATLQTFSMSLIVILLVHGRAGSRISAEL